MSKLSIPKRTELEIEIYDKAWKITKPQVEQLENVYADIARFEAGEINKRPSELWMDFFEKLGIERDFLKTIETDHMVQLIDFVTGAKKKS